MFAGAGSFEKNVILHIGSLFAFVRQSFGAKAQVFADRIYCG